MDQQNILDVIIRVVIATGCSVAAAWLLAPKIMELLDPTNAQKKRAKALAERILNEIGVKNVELTEHELMIAAHVVTSQEPGVDWKDIGGYEEQIGDLQDNVILPLKLRSKSNIFSPPHGVLLYGPPGCGKTLIAKAVAKAARARFINLAISTLTDKWYGESNKLATAVFSLAKKLQPSIIFIDEIDSFLRSRSTHDHEATAMMKALFMSLWDGFESDPSCRIVVMGATNRPQDVDPAILRRMPARFWINIPDEYQRKSILEVILRNEKLADTVNTGQLAKLTTGFVGSDLKEVARLAAVIRAKDLLVDAVLIDDEQSRPLTQEDFLAAIKKCKRSGCLAVLTDDPPD